MILEESAPYWKLVLYSDSIDVTELAKPVQPYAVQHQGWLRYLPINWKNLKSLTLYHSED
jgi:hypothetical protein